MLEVQKAVKDNASTMQDYLRDLDSWSEQMEAKDEQLKKAKKEKKNTLSGSGSKKPVVSVDSSASKHSTEKSPPKKPKKDHTKTEKLNPTGAGKIKAYDYAAWDKFDVEAACEETEKDHKSEESDEDLSEEEELEGERLRLEAVAEKDKGNNFFKAGKWDQAIEKYTRGMQLDPMNCMLPANRAMALLKKQQYAAAETDCTLALSLDPTYIKALQRRATARDALNKLELALADFDQVLKLEPTNKAASVDREKVVKKLADRDQPREVENIATKQYDNFNEKMKGALNKEQTPVKILPTETKALVKKEVGDSAGDKTIVEGQVFPIKKAAHSRSQKPLKRIEIIDIDEDVVNVVKELKVSKDNTVREHGTESEVRREKKAETKSFGFVKKIEKEICNDISMVELVDSITEVPKTSSKFIFDWKQLKTVVNRSKYLRMFKENDYRKVFKSSLDGVLFSEIVLVLNHLVQRGVDPEIVVQQLKGLSSLPRVSAVAMFMSSQDQEKMRYIIGELECVNQGDKDLWKKAFSL